MSLLRVDNLSVVYPKQNCKALDGVSFELLRGQALGVVGESGCGKSTLIRAILQLQAYRGDVYWKDKKLDYKNIHQKKQFYQHVQLIFQDPLDALNPRLSPLAPIFAWFSLGFRPLLDFVLISYARARQ